MTRCCLSVAVLTSFSLLTAASGVDEILEVHDTSLTTYVPTSVSGVQGIRPLVEQRGVAIDGSRRAGTTHRMALNGNPFGGGIGSIAKINGTRMDTGTFLINDVDLSFPATVPWVIGRSYNSRQKDSGGSYFASDGYQGMNWFQSSQPELVFHDSETDSEDMIYLVYGADRFIEFRRADDTGSGDSTDTFRAVNGAAGAILLHTFDSCDLATYYDQNGMRSDFFWFGDADIDDDIEGSLWRIMDPTVEVDPYNAADRLVTGDGNTAYIGDIGDPATAQTNGYVATTGAVTEAYDSAGRRFTYTYTSGVLTQVKAEVNPGSWTEVGNVDYTYYVDADTYGEDDDLETVTITRPLTDSGIDSTRQKYYRYYEGSYHATNNPGYHGQIEYAYDFEGVRNYDWSVDSLLDDDHLTANETTLKPYASAYFKYDTDRRIVAMWANGSCGCSGAASGTHEFKYETNGSFSGTSGYDTTWYGRTIVEKPTTTNKTADDSIESWVTKYFDETGQPLSKVLTNKDPGATPTKTWATEVTRDSHGVLTKINSPANITGYTHSTGAISVSSTVGLVSWVSPVNPPNEQRGLPYYRKSSTGNGGSRYYDLKTPYTLRSLTVGDFEVLRPLQSSQTVYTQAITTGSTGAVTTTMAYTYHGATSTAVQYLAIKQATTTYPAVTTANNGSNSATTEKQYLRLDGTGAFSEAEDGIFSYSQYTDGQLTKSIADVLLTGTFDTGDDPNTDFGITETSDGWDRVTEYAYDDQGRPDIVTPPSGKPRKTYYSRLADERLVRLSYAGFDDLATDKYFGPVGYLVKNHAGSAEMQGVVALASNESTAALTAHVDETDDDPITAMDLGTMARMSTSVLDETGTVASESRAYFDIPASGAGSDGTNYDASFMAYNDQGKRIRSEAAHGTVSRQEVDTLGRVVASYVGTNDADWDNGDTTGTDNLVKIAETTFDSGNDSGNSYVTKQTAFVVDSATDKQETSFEHDVKGRVLLVTAPNAPHTFTKYDHMGRTVASGQFSSTGSIVVGTDDPTTETTNRLSLSQSFYDERGRTWKSQRHKIDDADGSDDDNLQALSWFDAVGRTIKTDGDQLSKAAYDRLGRSTHQFVLARDNDAAYADTDDVAGDIVLVEIQTTYESSDSNDVLMRAMIRRHHDDFGGSETTGALDTNADGDELKYTAANVEGRIQISATWFDDLGRPESTVTYGTYGGSDFDRDGLTVPIRSDTALRTDVTYATSGQRETATDPEGNATKWLFDDGGRQTAVIADFGGSDDYTRFEYTDGLRVKFWVDLNGDGDDTDAGDQVTEYTYGTIASPGTGHSHLATGHLLSEIAYPDSGGASDVVEFRYNAQSRRVSKEDQAGNVIDQLFDTSGRAVTTTVATLAAGFDGAVRRIERAYDSLGRPTTITQYNAAKNGSVVDEVKCTYSDWSVVSKFEQDHDSAIGGDYLYDVDFAFAKATSGRNTLRMSSWDLPNGDTVSYTYTDDSTHDDDQASRATSVSLDTGSGAVAVADYSYNGVSQIVGISYPEIDVMRNLYGTTSGTYPDLDRFGRVTSDTWEKDLATDIAFYDVDVSFDRNSNITDLDEQAIHVGFDMQFTMDDRDRLTDFEQGTLSGGSITSKTRDEDWTLTQTGNWGTYKLDEDGDATLEIDGKNLHNDANELTSRDIDFGTNPGTDFSPTHDDTGSMDDDDENYEYVYDAFGRLRKIQETGTSDLIAEYTYNGLGYRIGWHYDVDADGDTDGDDSKFRWVYDTRWRIVATYREDDANPKEQFVYHGASGSYIDDAILRDKDDNTAWNSAADSTMEQRHYFCQNWRHDVVVVVDSAGAQVEQVRYSPYGIPFGLPAGDVDSDGDVDAADLAVYDLLGYYEVRMDMDLDGDKDAADRTVIRNASGDTLGLGALSLEGNRKGYAGYEFDGALSSAQRLYHVRYRVLNADLGRWTIRDPAGNIDGPNLYQYAISNPTRFVDSTGLSPGVGTEDEDPRRYSNTVPLITEWKFRREMENPCPDGWTETDDGRRPREGTIISNRRREDLNGLAYYYARETKLVVVSWARLAEIEADCNLDEGASGSRSFTITDCSGFTFGGSFSLPLGIGSVGGSYSWDDCTSESWTFIFDLPSHTTKDRKRIYYQKEYENWYIWQNWKWENGDSPWTRRWVEDLGRRRSFLEYNVKSTISKYVTCEIDCNGSGNPDW